MNDDRLRSGPRQRGTKHPALLRAGLFVFAAGVAVASILGIAANVYPQQILLIEAVRHFGLLLMLAGMAIVLLCLPTVGWWIGGIVSFVQTRLKAFREPAATSAPIQAALVEEPPPGVPLSA